MLKSAHSPQPPYFVPLPFKIKKVQCFNPQELGRDSLYRTSRSHCNTHTCCTWQKAIKMKSVYYICWNCRNYSPIRRQFSHIFLIMQSHQPRQSSHIASFSIWDADQKQREIVSTLAALPMNISWLTPECAIAATAIRGSCFELGSWKHHIVSWNKINTVCSNKFRLPEAFFQLFLNHPQKYSCRNEAYTNDVIFHTQTEMIPSEHTLKHTHTHTKKKKKKKKKKKNRCMKKKKL